MAEKVKRDRIPRHQLKSFEEISRKYEKEDQNDLSHKDIRSSFNYEDENKQREFLKKVFYRIFDFDPAAKKCVPTILESNGQSELIFQDIAISGMDGRSVDGALRGRPLSTEEALAGMAKCIYYDHHYYFVIDNPHHLSYITADDLSRLADTLDPVRAEIQYLGYIRPTYQQSLSKDLLDLKTEWIKQGYSCIDVDSESHYTNPVKSPSWTYLNDELMYLVTCECGAVFKADLQEMTVQLGGGNEYHEYRVKCPECGKFIGEKIHLRRCRYCGKSFEIPLQNAGRYREFCDDECKQKYLRFERRFLNSFSGPDTSKLDLDKIGFLYNSGYFPKDIESRFMFSQCRYCGKELSPDKRVGSEFCDESCKKAFKYKLKKWRTFFPETTSDDFVIILRKGRDQTHKFWLKFMRLKWWIVGGASLDDSYIDWWRNQLGSEFDRVVEWIKRENEKEKADPRVRDENLKRLTKILGKGKLDLYPATEEFYLKGYFGDEFEGIVNKISQDIQAGKKEL